MPAKVFRVIGSEGEQLGLLNYQNAQKIADDHGMDLVLISPQAEPPVCKIIDYGRFKFERDKREKEAKKKQQTMDIKEIQLKCQIDTNDFNTKVNHAKRFLNNGDKVKVVVRFRGRQMSYQDTGKDLLNRFIESCSEVGGIDKNPVMEGRNLTAFIAPLKLVAGNKAKAAAPQEKEAEKAPAENEADN